MGKSSAFNKMISAPAAMILAAAVTTAVSSAAPVSARPPAALPSFSWVLNAGAAGGSVNAGVARAFFAHQAASHIRELDRVSCAAPHRTLQAGLAPREFAFASPEIGEAQLPGLNSVLSSHQHAAP